MMISSSSSFLNKAKIIYLNKKHLNNKNIKIMKNTISNYLKKNKRKRIEIQLAVMMR
jgi:hypothetical protein